METRKELKQAVEHRFLTGGLEVRKGETGAPEIFGYALKFGVSYDMGWFTEEIHRDALSGADMEDVRILFNHDVNQILGRTKSGTAKVGVDDVGMWYRAMLPESPVGETVRAAIERGDVDQSSWGFTLRYEDDSAGDEWQRKDGRDHRIIRNVRKVWDASPVTFPANPDTSVAKRSHDFHRSTPEPKQQDNQAISARLTGLLALNQ
ncbi:MAG: HK97 family phage prohead protease [Lewinellaceae bacterium]|nr:HK97 family phage prohead protease [Lewinellaceae bacterium]